MDKPSALRLADTLDAGENFYAESSLWCDKKLSFAVSEAAAELRRLHGVNAELLAALNNIEVSTHDAMTAALARVAIAKAEEPK